MAVPVFMLIEGKNQGEMTSNCGREENRENYTKVYKLTHSVEQPRDRHTGRATGKRTHQPFVVLKEMDVSSPLIYAAMCTNELLDIEFRFWRPTPEGDGTEQNFFTIKLEEANLIKYEGQVAFTLGEDSQHYPPLEELQFSYRKITVTEEIAGVEAEDSWDLDLA